MAPKIAVSNTPVAPPTPCTASTSRASSTFTTRLTMLTAKKHSTPAAKPMTSAPAGPTKPDAGVMVARPAMAPVAMPTSVGLP